MKDLPINEILPQLKNTLKTTNQLILEAPAGAGKSTVVPICLLEEFWLKEKIIIILEPRRVAARMVATQMAKLLGEEVGQTIGYQIKMDSCTSFKTKVLVVTEAILVRKLQADQALENIAMVIFDEFHERSIHSDLSLALCLQVQELLRDDLKLLLMSATLNSCELLKLLPKAQTITSKGRLFPIEEVYLPKSIKQPDVKSINELLVSTVLESIKEQGDVLVFLAGAKQIKKLQESLVNRVDTTTFSILPLYSNLSKIEQDKALFKSKKRKIILSTNIAQTSVTIEGIKTVIDSGLENQAFYNYETGLNHLELKFIGEDSSIQRAGRAGRLSSGKCFNLWHKDKILQKSIEPEILRLDLTQTLLEIALWGAEFSDLSWLNIPKTKSLEKTKELLVELQMLDDKGEITNLGKDAINLGLHPRFAFMLLKANELGFAYEASILASLLMEKDIYKNSFKNADINGRFLHLYEKDFSNSFINRFQAQEVLKQAKYFFEKLKKVKNIQKSKKPFVHDLISVLLLFAYPDRLAKQRIKNDNRYKLSNKKGAILDLEDSLFNEEFLVVPTLSAKQKDSFINLASPISLENIQRYFSKYLNEIEDIKFDKKENKISCKLVTCFLDLELFSKSLEKPSSKTLEKLFLNVIKQEGLEFLSWDKKSLVLKNRVNFVNLNTKEELFLPDFTNKTLLETLDIWLKPYLLNIKTIKELQTCELYSILSSLISWENSQKLDVLAPETILVPSGSKIKIDYEDSSKPILKVKIQEMFGLKQSPKVLNGKVPLQIQLLSPALRPIQITYDLESFWNNSYEEVRKELRGKYKKHYWPQNPHEAQATNKTKKRMEKNG